MDRVIHHAGPSQNMRATTRRAGFHRLENSMRDDGRLTERIKDGQTLRVTGFDDDATEYQRVRAELRASEERFRLAADAVNGIIYDYDLQTRRVERSRGLFEVVGYSPQEVPPSPEWWSEQIHPDDRERVVNVDLNTLVCPTLKAEYRVRHKDGRWLHVEDRAVVVRDTDGRPARIVGCTVDVTERRQAEEKLTDAKVLLQSLLAKAPLGFCYFDRELRYQLINERLAEINGIPAAAHVGKAVADVVPTLLPTVQKIVAQILAAGEPVKDHQFTGETAAQPGVTRHWNETWFPVRDASNAIIGFGVVVEEITARLRAEAALRESEEKYRNLFNSMQEGMFFADIIRDGAGKAVDLRFQAANPAFESHTGLNPRAIIGRTQQEVFPGIEDPLLETYSRVALTREPAHVEQFVPTLGRYYSLSIYSPRVGQVCVLIFDVTDRKQAEAALHESEAALQTFLHTAATGLMRNSRNLRYRAVNATYATLVGRSVDQIVGRTLGEVLGERALEKIRPHVERVLRGERVEYEGELPFDGTGPRWVEVSYVPDRDASGEIIGWVGSINDIGSRKRAEAALRESEERLRQAADLIGLCPYTWDPASGALEWSARLKALWGLPPDAPVNHDVWLAHIHPEDRVRVEERSARSLEPSGDGIYEGEYRVNGADGVERWVSARGRTRFADGKAVGHLGVAVEVTARKQAEAALREADRRKDEFLATLAHELRNPLAPIRNAVEVLRLMGPQDSKLQRLRDAIERNVTHMSRLVDDLLEVSRIVTGKIELRMERVNLTTIVQHAVETSSPLVEAGRHELTVATPEPIEIEGDAVRLTQVVTNLLNNAATYTPHGGQIWVSVERQNAEGVVRVKDTGPGIPTEMRNTVFDLFSRVKDSKHRSAKGLGIGLALVKRLVNMHGGQVEAGSAEGGGAEFIVRLPLCHDARSQNHVEDQAMKRVSVASCRILLVDDNADAADTHAMLLSMMGHQVRTVYDGRSAIVQATAFRPDVVLLDLGMPDMDGYETARKLRELPGIEAVRLVALSGWGQSEDRRRTKEAGFYGHLVKPVAVAALEEMLATVKN